MRRHTILVLGVVFSLFLTGCSQNLTDKDKIISLYREHESVFNSAVETGDFSEVEKIRGISEVKVYSYNEEIEFLCGGQGLGPSTSYYGIRYRPDAVAADYAEVFGDSPEWYVDGNGYRFQESGGDNDFYFEFLGNGFYYFEEHF